MEVSKCCLFNFFFQYYNKKQYANFYNINADSHEEVLNASKHKSKRIQFKKKFSSSDTTESSYSDVNVENCNVSKEF